MSELSDRNKCINIFPSYSHVTMPGGRLEKDFEASSSFRSHRVICILHRGCVCEGAEGGDGKAKEEEKEE